MKSRNIILFAFCLVITVVVGKLLAQTATSTHSDESPGDTSVDATFMKTLAAGGMAEVDVGELAKSKASNKEVKHFAERMVREHSKNNEQLQALANKKQVSLSASVDAGHAAAKAELEKAEGARFDAEYMQIQVKDHRRTARLLQHEINSGQDAEVRVFAQKTLTVVQHHLQMARDLRAKVSQSSR